MFNMLSFNECEEDIFDVILRYCLILCEVHIASELCYTQCSNKLGYFLSLVGYISYIPYNFLDETMMLVIFSTLVCGYMRYVVVRHCRRILRVRGSGRFNGALRIRIFILLSVDLDYWASLNSIYSSCQLID